VVRLPCADRPTLDIHPSCAAIPSTVDGVYAIDPDGPDQGEDPYCTYCLMSAQGGGWTLFASHEDGVAERMVTDPVEPGVPGVVSAARWAERRDGMTSGMLFVDENGVTSFLSTSTLAANCATPDDVTDLTGTSRLYLWHDENSGCTTTGTDYSIVGLTGSDYVLYESAGAALWQRSGLRFDTWGYGGLQHSYEVQDRLLYFIK